MKRVISFCMAFLLLCMAGCSAKGKTISQNEANQASAEFQMANVTSAEQLKTKVIGALRGTFPADAVVKAGIPIETYESFEEMYAALENGTISGMALDEPTALSACISYSSLSYIPFENNSSGFQVDISQSGKAAGVKKGSALKKQINEILGGITPQIRKELMAQMVTACAGGTVSALALADDSAPKKSGTLKVAMECAYEPYNWFSEQDGNFAVKIKSGKTGYANGYDVQIAKYVAHQLGKELEIITADYDAMFNLVAHGDADLLISGVEPTAERAKLVDFTDVYYEANVVVAYIKNA